MMLVVRGIANFRVLHLEFRGETCDSYESLGVSFAPLPQKCKYLHVVLTSNPDSGVEDVLVKRETTLFTTVSMSKFK